MCDGKFDTREVLERAFRNYFQDEHLGILSFDVQPAVAVGDNYTSNMLRVDVKYLKSQNQNEESMSVLVKVQLSDLSMSIIYDELNLFAKEMEMFGKTLPLMYEVLGLEREESLSAPCLLTTDDPLPILVLKDLKPFGYKMSSRQTGLDFEHCKLVLEKLAKFHAASAVIVDKDPSLVKNYPSGMYNEGQVLGPWINKGITSLIKVCKIWPGMEKYAVKLEKYLEELEKRGKTAASRGMELGEMDGFKVINHGDVWTNNLLFQYDDDNKPINIKFVDFQIAHYSSPVLDVHFFFATSADIEVHRKYIGTLLEHYFHHFSNTMSSISNNSLKNAFDWTSFIEEYKRRSFHGVLAATSVAPAARADNRDDANFENLTQDEADGNFRHHCFNNDIFREFMEVYIPYLDSLGALEYK